MTAPLISTLAAVLVAAAPASPSSVASARPVPLVLAPLEGAVPQALPAQLAEALFAEAPSVPFEEVERGTGFDLERLRLAGAGGLVAGLVVREAGGRVLFLSVFTRDYRPAQLWRLPVEAGGRVAPQALAQAVAELRRRVEAGRSAPLAAARPAAPLRTIVTAPLDLRLERDRLANR